MAARRRYARRHEHLHDRRRHRGTAARLRRHAHHRRRASGARPRTPTRRAPFCAGRVELGVNLIDTADSYGPEVSEKLIAEALHPYPEGLLIATKGGLRRTGPGEWPRDARPERLKECCEGSLRRLKLDRIDLYQLHSPDPKVPLEDSLGALKELQDEGKIRHIGVSNVSRRRARARPRARGRRHGAEPLQPRGPPLGGRARRLHRGRHRLHPLVPARHGRAGAAGRPARRGRRATTTPRRARWRSPGCSAAPT